jgi:hypothetical protein
MKRDILTIVYSLPALANGGLTMGKDTGAAASLSNA